ncbi:MAG: GlsB/YeaQ/YmgE family stress response membrane protein [Chloroflexota bacterium]|jgi:uncharacterized membrane protein YeaQ/YmgE (transglycosylase-associated protein family)
MLDMDVVGWVVIGFIAGALSSVVFRDRAGTGCLATLVIGILGGAVGGLIARDVFGLDRTEGFLGALVVAVGGAVLIRFLIALVTPRR